MASTQPIMRCRLADILRAYYLSSSRNIAKSPAVYGPLELELQVVVCCLTWVLGIELRPTSESSMKY